MLFNWFYCFCYYILLLSLIFLIPEFIPSNLHARFLFLCSFILHRSPRSYFPIKIISLSKLFTRLRLAFFTFFASPSLPPFLFLIAVVSLSISHFQRRPFATSSPDFSLILTSSEILSILTLRRHSSTSSCCFSLSVSFLSFSSSQFVIPPLLGAFPDSYLYFFNYVALQLLFFALLAKSSATLFRYVFYRRSFAPLRCVHDSPPPFLSPLRLRQFFTVPLFHSSLSFFPRTSFSLFRPPPPSSSVLFLDFLTNSQLPRASLFFTIAMFHSFLFSLLPFPPLPSFLSAF